VLMRHGTHKATQIRIAQMPLAILGGFLGRSSSIGSQLAQLGIGLGVNSILLKNSRGAESQSDEIGTYILYRAGYDPYAMARFFEIIEKKYPQRTIEFFASHPNPENRVKKVDAFIPQLGPARAAEPDSLEFQAVKKRLLAMPVPPKGKPAPGASPSPAAPPAPPSNRVVNYRGNGFAVNYPDNWQVQASEDGVTLAPPGAVVTGPQGGTSQAYGAAVTRHVPPKQKGWGLIEATQQLIDSMRRSNPNLRVVSQTSMRIRRRPAVSTLLENDSPLQGQKETDQLVTVRGGDALIAVMFVAPQAAWDAYRPTFAAMLKSFELR